MKKYVNIARRLVSIIRRDGVYPLLSKTVKIVRQEGVAGLKRRVGRREIVSNTYAEWIKKYDHLDEIAEAALKSDVAAMTAPPRISVVMPTYNADPAWLTAAIDSVRNQIYPHWELCIADDASTKNEIRLLLERYAQKDAPYCFARREWPYLGGIEQRLGAGFFRLGCAPRSR
jgi:hypothetical protein